MGREGSKDGHSKRMRLILEERGVNTEGMNIKQIRETLKPHPDFKYQKCKLENYVQERDHICIFYPKLYIELSPVERVWCQSK